MDDNKKERLAILIIVLSVFLLPSIVGIPLMLVFQRSVILESLYAIFGTLTLLFGLFRSWRRDSKNYRKEHTVVEDKDTKEYKAYRRMQLTLYITGASLLVLTVIVYVLGVYVLKF